MPYPSWEVTDYRIRLIARLHATKMTNHVFQSNAGNSSSITVSSSFFPAFCHAGLWDVSSQPGIKPTSTAIEAGSLNHLTTGSPEEPPQLLDL